MRDNFFIAWARPASAPRSRDSDSRAEETSSTIRAAFIIKARSPARLSSSPVCGAKSDSSWAAARTKSASAWARSANAFNASSDVRAADHSPYSIATVWASPFSPPKPSSKARWVAVSNRPRSSCWPCTSNSESPNSFSRPTPTAWSLMKARLRPSPAKVRRNTISPLVSMSWSRNNAQAPCAFSGSNTAVAEPWFAPARTAARPLEPVGPPTASPSESSKMDLPAPVSPVSTFRPGANSSSACSISTMSRIVSAASTLRLFESLEHFVESLTDPGTLVFLGLQIAALENVKGVAIPARAGIVVPQHGGGRLRLAVQAQAVIGFADALQGFGDLGRGLVLVDHGAETVDGADIVALVQVIA